MDSNVMNEKSPHDADMMNTSVDDQTEHSFVLMVEHDEFMACGSSPLDVDWIDELLSNWQQYAGVETNTRMTHRHDEFDNYRMSTLDNSNNEHSGRSNATFDSPQQWTSDADYEPK